MVRFLNQLTARAPTGTQIDFSPIERGVNSLIQQRQQSEQMDFRREQAAKSNDRADANLDMRRQEFGASQNAKRVKQMAGLAQAALQDPEGGMQLFQRRVMSDPKVQRALADSGIDINDPVSAAKMMVAEARGYVDPLERRHKEALIAKAERGPAAPAEVREYQFARKNGFEGSYADWKKQGGTDSSPTERIISKLRESDPSLSYTDAVTLAKRGYGLTFKGDTGFDRFGNPVVNTGDAIARGKRSETVGKAQGEAQADLPRAAETSKRLVRTLEGLRDDPYLDQMVGSVQGRAPNLTSKAARVQSKMDQVTGQAFLEAFQQLKGGGHITEIEGEKATAAITRLGTVTMNEGDYKAAANELIDIAKRGEARARREAQGAQPNSTTGGIDVGGGFTVRIR